MQRTLLKHVILASCMLVLFSLQSGQIHYFNTRTHKRTWTRPRGDHHQHQHGGLDLELNLAFDPRRAGAGEDRRLAAEKEAATPPVPDAAWEMVAAVCMRCHMLVMMCRACPACPNCKFLHPMGQQPGAVARASPPAEAAAPAKLGLPLFENTS